MTKCSAVCVSPVLLLLRASVDVRFCCGPVRFAVLRDPAGWLSVNPVRGTVNTSASLDRESPFVHDNKYTAVFLATDNGEWRSGQVRLV